MDVGHDAHGDELFTEAQPDRQAIGQGPGHGSSAAERCGTIPVAEIGERDISWLFQKTQDLGQDGRRTR